MDETVKLRAPARWPARLAPRQTSGWGGKVGKVGNLRTGSKGDQSFAHQGVVGSCNAGKQLF
jgi:hypothetical protein